MGRTASWSRYHARSLLQYFFSLSLCRPSESIHVPCYCTRYERRRWEGERDNEVKSLPFLLRVRGEREKEREKWEKAKEDALSSDFQGCLFILFPLLPRVSEEGGVGEASTKFNELHLPFGMLVVILKCP